MAPVSLALHSTWFPSQQPRVGEEARLLHEEHLHLRTLCWECRTADHQALHLDILPPRPPGKVPGWGQPTLWGLLPSPLFHLHNNHFWPSKHPWHYSIFQGRPSEVPSSKWGDEWALNYQIHLDFLFHSFQSLCKDHAPRHNALCLPWSARGFCEPILWKWPCWHSE